MKVVGIKEKMKIYSLAELTNSVKEAMKGAEDFHIFS